MREAPFCRRCHDVLEPDERDALRLATESPFWPRWQSDWSDEQFAASGDDLLADARQRLGIRGGIVLAEYQRRSTTEATAALIRSRLEEARNAPWLASLEA